MACAAGEDGNWGEAAVFFIVGVVVWVFAGEAWRTFGSGRFDLSRRRENPSSGGEAGDIDALLAARDEARRRVDELRRYADFCELEAKCWPEDSIDHAELVVYAEVAKVQADETLRRWLKIERAIRAERFEQIVGSKRS
jgi:hypothetical protein